MLWVDQPVGTGYSTGTPTATTLEETSRDFVNFFREFETLFGVLLVLLRVVAEIALRALEFHQRRVAFGCHESPPAPKRVFVLLC